MPIYVKNLSIFQSLFFRHFLTISTTATSPQLHQYTQISHYHYWMCLKFFNLSIAIIFYKNQSQVLFRYFSTLFPSSTYSVTQKNHYRSFSFCLYVPLHLQCCKMGSHLHYKIMLFISCFCTDRCVIVELCQEMLWLLGS